MRNPYLCIVIVVTLGLATLSGIAGLILLAYVGKPTPESLVATVAACTGALSSFLVQPPRGSIGGGRGPVTYTERSTHTQTGIKT